MIYTKPISEILYDDIINFCNEGHIESSILEYKLDFPSNEVLAKTIAAFANTYGGILIIGVNAPKGKPIPPFEGIEFDSSSKYEEKVESIVLSHIKEPVFPEIQVCEPMNGKTFILIRVAESHLTPHRVSNNRRIYVRTGQSSTPNAEATWDNIEWLVSRRKKSEELREIFIEESERYFNNACKLRGIDLKDEKSYFATLSIRTVPLFPQGPLIPFRELDKIKNDIQYPLISHQKVDSIQNGIHKLCISEDLKKPAQGKWFKYIHLNSYGLYLSKKNIGEIETVELEEEKLVKTFRFTQILIELYDFLSSAFLFYQKLGYWGTVQITVELSIALGVYMKHQDIKSDKMLVPSDRFKWEKTVGIPYLKEKMQNVVIELIDAVAWSLGIKYLTEDRIKKSIREIKQSSGYYNFP